MDDHWLTEALTDDALVVHLLFRLKQSSLPFYHPANQQPLRWGRRRRRSIPATCSRKESEPARCSPTTPLSWSGGSDGCYESRRPSLKSKGAFASVSPMATAYKKSRKKQSFGELKDKESQLLKEKVHLKKDLASLHVTMKEQKARNDKLTKIKIRLNLPPTNKNGAAPSKPVAATSGRCNQTKSSPIGQSLPILQKHAMGVNGVAPPSFPAQKYVEPHKSCFSIPDLNTMPLEQELVPEALTQIS